MFIVIAVSAFVAAPALAGSGVIGGQAGCNLDLGSKWLIGVEGDAAWTHITNGNCSRGRRR
jgi:hypothetical protein